MLSKIFNALFFWRKKKPSYRISTPTEAGEVGVDPAFVQTGEPFTLMQLRDFNGKAEFKRDFHIPDYPAMEQDHYKKAKKKVEESNRRKTEDNYRPSPSYDYSPSFFDSGSSSSSSDSSSSDSWSGGGGDSSGGGASGEY